MTDDLSESLKNRIEEWHEEFRKEWNRELLPMMCFLMWVIIFFFGGFLKGGNPYISSIIGIPVAIGIYILFYDKKTKE